MAAVWVGLLETPRMAARTAAGYGVEVNADGLDCLVWPRDRAISTMATSMPSSECRS